MKFGGNGNAQIVVVNNSKGERSVFENLVDIGVPFHTGFATNRLNIERIRSDLFLYVNAYPALQAQTDGMQSGVVRLGAATIKRGGADYLYDNLTVERL